MNSPWLGTFGRQIPVLRPASVQGWHILIEGLWESADEQDPNAVRFQYSIGIQPTIPCVAPQVVLELGTHAEFIPRDRFVFRSFARRRIPFGVRGAVSPRQAIQRLVLSTRA